MTTKKKNRILIFLSHARTNEQRAGVILVQRNTPKPPGWLLLLGFTMCQKASGPRRQQHRAGSEGSGTSAFHHTPATRSSTGYINRYFTADFYSFLENYALPVALTQISPCSATILVHLPGVWQEERTNPLQLRSTQDFFLFPRRSFPLATVTLGLLLSALGGLSGAWAQKAGKVLSECFPM